MLHVMTPFPEPSMSRKRSFSRVSGGGSTVFKITPSDQERYSAATPIFKRSKLCEVSASDSLATLNLLSINNNPNPNTNRVGERRDDERCRRQLPRPPPTAAATSQFQFHLLPVTAAANNNDNTNSTASAVVPTTTITTNKHHHNKRQRMMMDDDDSAIGDSEYESFEDMNHLLDEELEVNLETALAAASANGDVESPPSTASIKQMVRLIAKKQRERIFKVCRDTIHQRLTEQHDIYSDMYRNMSIASQVSKEALQIYS